VQSAVSIILCACRSHRTVPVVLLVRCIADDTLDLVAPTDRVARAYLCRGRRAFHSRRGLCISS
jgi:hypothetical protein